MTATVIEAMLLRYGDTSASGRTVTFQLPDDGGQHPFKGLKCGPANGQRLALSVALIDDDESVSSAGLDNTAAPAEPQPNLGKGNPAQEPQPPTDTGRDRRVRTEAQRAGFLCTTESFQRFLYERCMVTTMDADEAAAAYREYCGVKSRADIDADPDAVERSRELRADYDVWQRALV